MPALHPVVGVAETQFVMVIQGRTISNRLFWQDEADAGYTAGDMSALATAAGDAWKNHVMLGMSQDVTFTQCIATDLTSETAPREFSDYSQTGGQLVGAEPLNVAAVLKIDIARRYRGGKNHIYLGGIATGYRTTDDYWNSGFISGWEGYFAALTAAVESVTTSHAAHWAQCTVSRMTAHAVRATPLVDPVLSFEIQPRVCTRRRRLPKITT